MKWVGLTGPIGAGKTEVSKVLKSEGYVVLSADLMAKKVIEENFKTLLQSLNIEFIRNKEELKEWALKNQNNLNRLESFVHPLVRKKVEEEKRKHKSESMVFYEIPLLFEKNLENSFDLILLVATTKRKRKKRLLKKGFLEEKIQKLISRQNDIEDSKKKAHFIIENEGSLEGLKKTVKKTLFEIQGLL